MVAMETSFFFLPMYFRQVVAGGIVQECHNLGPGVVAMAGTRSSGHGWLQK